MCAKLPRPGSKTRLMNAIGALAFFNQGIEQLIRDHQITDPQFKKGAMTAADAFQQFQDISGK